MPAKFGRLVHLSPDEIGHPLQLEDIPPPVRNDRHSGIGGAAYLGMKRLRVIDTATGKFVSDSQGPCMRSLETGAARVGYPESDRYAYLR
jgi:hypothetical protein